MRHNIYIKEEDESLWGALENKSEWVHLNLHKKNTPSVYTQQPPKNKTIHTLDIPGLVKGSEFKPKKKLGECLRHRIDKSVCGCTI